jgi:hypothetical protein
MHATVLVGINGITRVLLVTCQQGVHPRGHVLPLRLPHMHISQSFSCIFSYELMELIFYFCYYYYYY